MTQPLKVFITSFSYKYGLPDVRSGHGGGFVFDCRCLPNPGREEKYKKQTGLDREVREYLENLPQAREYWNTVSKLVQQAVDAYQLRGFTELEVSFGCTGGQHRSVYFAEKLSQELRSVKDLNVVVKHREIEQGRIVK
jgi:RNase adaptor protein for sRNA GlmZ degradation